MTLYHTHPPLETRTDASVSPTSSRGRARAHGDRFRRSSSGSRARASRALDDVDVRARRARSPSPSPSRRSRRSTRRPSLFTPSVPRRPRGDVARGKALPIRATRSWACSNGGFLRRSTRLRREASPWRISSSRPSRAFGTALYFGCLGRGRRVSRVGSDRDARGGRVPRARDRIRVRDARVCRYDRTQGAQSDEVLRWASATRAGVAAGRVPRYRRARSLGVVVLCAAGWGVAYGMKKLDPSHSFSRRVRPETPRPSSSMNRAAQL